MSNSEYKLVWEEQSIIDRGDIYEFLYEYASVKTAENVDEEIERMAVLLSFNPEMGVVKKGFHGRCLVLKKVPYFIFYCIDHELEQIKIMKILNQKKKNK